MMGLAVTDNIGQEEEKDKLFLLMCYLIEGVVDARKGVNGVR